jgi:hypothetical protein
VNRYIASAIGGLGVDSGLQLPGESARVHGWRRFVVKPVPAAVRALEQGSAYRRTPRGDANVQWRRQSNRVEINVTVPSGTRATVHVPLLDATSVRVVGDGRFEYDLGCAVDVRSGARPSVVETATSSTRHIDGGVCGVRRDGERVLVLDNVGVGSYSFTVW